MNKFLLSFTFALLLMSMGFAETNTTLYVFAPNQLERGEYFTVSVDYVAHIEKPDCQFNLSGGGVSQQLIKFGGTYKFSFPTDLDLDNSTGFNYTISCSKKGYNNQSLTGRVDYFKTQEPLPITTNIPKNSPNWVNIILIVIFVIAFVIWWFFFRKPIYPIRSR